MRSKKKRSEKIRSEKQSHDSNRDKNTLEIRRSYKKMAWLVVDKQSQIAYGHAVETQLESMAGSNPA